MGSLVGFHPPHLSEEDAWVPAWLQTITTTRRDQSPSSSAQAFDKEIQQTQNGDDGRCKTLHLYLSGEDDITFPSSSVIHEVPYQLRLSTNEESQYSLLTPPQAHGFKPLLVHDPDAKLILDDEAYMIPSRQSNDLGVPLQESVSVKDQKRINPKAADARSRKVSIKDAIELAVSASEALTIHEVLKDDEPILDLSAASSVVLEAVIRVKQARLEELRETLSSSIEESNDFCSDLDELTMADAYEDVGLTVANNHGDLSAYGSISHVKDSFASESFISNAKHKYNEHGDLDVDSLKQQNKQVTKEHAEYDEALDIENADLACNIDPVFSCSVEQASLCMTEVGLQREGFVIGDQSSSKTIFRSSIHRRSSGFNEREEDKKTNLVPERFQSRWFGGWTWKDEANIPSVSVDFYKRSIPEVFANEASSLSESADIAPDQNSCIQRHDKECKTVSQSSIALEHTYEKGSDGGNFLSADVAVYPSVDPECTNDKVACGNLISDDVAATPDMSPLDPLCSVVPCSFNSNNVVSQNCKQQVNLEGPVAETNLDNNPSKGLSPQSEGRSISEVNGEVRKRNVTPLKTYSMLYPRSNLYLDKERTRDESLPCEHAATVVPSVMQTSALDTNDDHDHDQTAKGNTSHVDKGMNLPMAINKCKSYLVPGRKRVRFSEAEVSYPKIKKIKTPQTRLKDPLISNRIIRRLRSSKLQPKSGAHEVERRNITYKKMLFQDLKFLLTGFSVKKHKQIKNLIQKNGGVVVDNIPSPSTCKGKRGSKYKSQLLPLILCPRRLLTAKFLYGCAVNACILKVNWLFDSLDDGSILPPKKYIVIKEHAGESCMVIGKPVSDTCGIFDNIAIMLHGKPDFYTKMAKVIKHGGGLVFKSVHWLVKSLESKRVSVGAIVVEDENVISRQLKQCALEQKIPMISFTWIINSLYAGRLVSSPEVEFSSASEPPIELSEEI